MLVAVSPITAADVPSRMASEAVRAIVVGGFEVHTTGGAQRVGTHGRRCVVEQAALGESSGHKVGRL